jgi:hypothetical protein
MNLKQGGKATARKDIVFPPEVAEGSEHLIGLPHTLSAWEDISDEDSESQSQFQSQSQSQSTQANKKTKETRCKTSTSTSNQCRRQTKTFWQRHQGNLAGI